MTPPTLVIRYDDECGNSSLLQMTGPLRYIKKAELVDGIINVLHAEEY
jgi:hypothetical protein